MTDTRHPILPDLLAPNIRLVICGTAAGARSAALKAYYAGRGNLFWEILFQTGLTPTRLRPEEFERLRQYGIGLTDLAKYASGSDESLRRTDFDSDAFRSAILERGLKYLRAVAFNGKRAAQIYFGRATVGYGRQEETLGPAAIFVLPSTSAMARQYWSADRWKELADFLLSPESCAASR